MDPHTTCGEGGDPAGAAVWEAISNQKRSKETLQSGFSSAEQRIGVGKGGGGVDQSGACWSAGFLGLQLPPSWSLGFGDSDQGWGRRRKREHDGDRERRSPSRSASLYRTFWFEPKTNTRGRTFYNHAGFWFTVRLCIEIEQNDDIEENLRWGLNTRQPGPLLLWRGDVSPRVGVPLAMRWW